MKTVLITGPIASGKSLCSRYLESRGFPVYDCDSRTKALYDLIPGLKERIEKALDIRWEQIGVIFTDEEKRKRLESIVYPLVLEDIRQWKESQTKELLFIESAIAMEKPEFDSSYDEVVMVIAPLGLREQRNPAVAQRDHLQSFDLERIHHVIENDGTKEDLYFKIDKLLCKLI